MEKRVALVTGGSRGLEEHCKKNLLKMDII